MFVMVTYLVLAVGVVFSWSGMIYISLSVHNIDEVMEAGACKSRFSELL